MHELPITNGLPLIMELNQTLDKLDIALNALGKIASEEADDAVVVASSALDYIANYSDNVVIKMK
jgi:hypothetical protein